MPTRVITIENEMVYDGVTRYRNEIFTLTNQRHDEKLVRHNYVRVIDGQVEQSLHIVRDDYSGREFTDESSLNSYRRKAPASDSANIIRRNIGRPKGAGDKAPRRATGVKTKAAPKATVPAE